MNKKSSAINNFSYKRNLLLIGLFLVVIQICIAGSAYCDEGEEQQVVETGSSAANISDTLKELTTLDSKTFVMSKDRLQNTGRRISINIESLEKSLEPYLGSWVSWQIISGISSLKALVFVLLILLVNFINWLCRWLIQRKVRSEYKNLAKNVDLRETAENMSSNLNAFLIALTRPLSLFIWVYGIFTGLSLLLDDSMKDEAGWLLATINQLTDILGFFAVFWLLFRCIALVDVRMTRWAEGTPSRWDTLLVPFIGKCLRFVLPLLAFILAIPMFSLNEGMQKLVQNATSIAIIASIAWILVQLVLTIEKGVVGHFKAGSGGSLKERAIFTQVYLLKKIILLVIGIFTLGSMLMVFETVRQLGTSILASAGVLGIIVGLSAQKTIAMLLAGLQIAITQPIRIEDVVIVENEWGRIEEITLTYVVVRVWDLRRLVIPINYFIEKPFQNWTKTSANIMGDISIFVDYTAPVDEIRQAAKEIVAASDLWDKKVFGVQITDLSERTMKLRVLISTSDSGKAWDLRCEVREKLITFIQKNYPGCLPKIRTDNPSASDS